MLRRTLLLSVALVSLAFLIEAQQHRQSKRTRKSSQTQERRRKAKPAKPPVTSFVTDSGGRELIVRLLDVGRATPSTSETDRAGSSSTVVRTPSHSGDISIRSAS